MIRVPSPATLKKYGLSEQEWILIYQEQNGCCPICEKPLDTRVCVDHEHVKGFKNMLPEQKKLYIRGLVHWFCNHYYLGRSITIQKAKNMVSYLEKYETRKKRTSHH